jgi:hypothetical protein
MTPFNTNRTRNEAFLQSARLCGNVLVHETLVQVVRRLGSREQPEYIVIPYIGRDESHAAPIFSNDVSAHRLTRPACRDFP